MTQSVHSNVALGRDLRDQTPVEFGLQSASHDLPSYLLKLALALGILCLPICEDRTISQILESVAGFEISTNGCFAGTNAAGNSKDEPFNSRRLRVADHERGILT